MSIKENSQKKVVITSKNPVKVNCVSNGFSKVFPDLNFEFVIEACSKINRSVLLANYVRSENGKEVVGLCYANPVVYDI